MARISAGETYTLTATGTVELGDAASHVMGTIVVQLVTSDFNGTVAPQAIVLGVDDDDYLGIAYRSATTEEVTSSGNLSFDSDADNRIIELNAGGRQVRLNVTRTSGSLEITFRPLLG